MLRIVIGDHSYKTGHTHQQALQLHQQPQPLELLSCMASGLWQRIQRRHILLAEQDFLHHVLWTHMPDMLMLINALKEESPAMPIEGDADSTLVPQVRYSCQHHTIPNLRRHCTTQHGESQHRTVPQTILQMALRGRPRCSHCHKIFTTWRRFVIHVERNCCQADTRPTPSSSSRAAHCKAEAEDFHVIHEPFWPVLVQILRNQDCSVVQQHANIGLYLTHTCMVCGLWNNRCQELHCHYQLHHPDLVPGIFVKSAQITKKVATDSPCVLCQKPFKRGHTCTVATQLAALMLHCMDTPGNSLRCDICSTDFETMALLHAHLHEVHEVPVHDWNAARDSIPSSNGCSHCGQVYETSAGLRRHITDGRCPYFNPGATCAPLNAVQKWEMPMVSGALSKQELTAHQRLQFTLHCQLCGEHYQRSTDLSAHLQQTHGSLWTKAGEMVRFMLQTMISKTGCLCNPNTNDRGRTHICNLVYQVAMIYHISEMELLIPWRYSEDEVRLAAKASKPGPSNRSINCCSMCSWIGTSVTSGMHRDFCSCSATGASAVEAGIIRLS